MYEYASVLYEEVQNEIFKDFEYQLERGVKPKFIIQTIKVPSDQEFFPRRKILLEAEKECMALNAEKRRSFVLRLAGLYGPD